VAVKVLDTLASRYSSQGEVGMRWSRSAPAIAFGINDAVAISHHDRHTRLAIAVEIAQGRRIDASEVGVLGAVDGLLGLDCQRQHGGGHPQQETAHTAAHALGPSFVSNHRKHRRS
jgi:hypothetical protein